MSKPFAVATANGKPLWIVVLCTELGTDGSLTGYAGGLYAKNGFWNMRAQQPKKSLF
jgi:methylated-DNA-[protein]-cysteine S-methyltransferase